MRIQKLLVLGIAAAVVAGCDGGDVNLGVSNIDNSTGGGGGNTPPPNGGGNQNPCASYTDPTTGALRQGSFDGTNCTYGSTFVSSANPLLVDLTIPRIDGVHIFEGSLFVGQNVNSGPAPAAGEGPTLTIEAGSTLAFTDSVDYVLINRGSRIIADGTADAPITFTAVRDAVDGAAGPEDVQLWGGIVINGNGLTNNCTDAERQNNQCHVLAEGQPSNYGGNDNSESSGILRYVVVKHTGFEVAPGNELNGITFNAVGSGTTVENVQVYSTYDDGVEFFGGAVDVTNLITMYVKDDSIDFSDGYVGTIRNALVIQPLNDGNRCVEGDNIGESRSEPLNTAPRTNPTIANMTCIVGNGKSPMNTHGDSEGVLLRFGAQAQIVDSIIYSGYGSVFGEQFDGAPRPSNECVEIEHDVSLADAAAGNSTITNSIVACEEATKGAFANADTLAEWVAGANPSTNGADYSFNTGNTIITDPTNANVSVLEPNSFYTATTLTDAAGNPIAITPTSGQLGAVTRANDWTAGWSFGLHADNRGQPLWFE